MPPPRDESLTDRLWTTLAQMIRRQGSPSVIDALIDALSGAERLQNRGIFTREDERFVHQAEQLLVICDGF